MKAINKSIEVLQDMESLIIGQQMEISMYRNVIYRYYLMHGVEIQGGIVEMPSNLSIHINSIKDAARCNIIDNEKIGIESTHQINNNKLKKLE